MSTLVDAIINLSFSISAQENAQALASQWQVPYSEKPHYLKQDGIYLVFDKDVVQLQQGGRKAPGPVFVDFISGANAHRRKFGGGKGQSIAKAIGITSAYQPSVIDATAGLGRDSFVLATLGCSVTMIERHPVVYELLKNGLERAQQACATEDPEVAAIIQRMSLASGNASELMAHWKGEQPDVIYLDPMFPHSESKAQVKKEMQIFREVVGHDLDEDELWQSADQLARCRIAVKRPRKAPFLAEQQPSYSLEGKANRFDIYAKKKVAPIEEG